ncbi:hypothetical protein CEP53_011585 [Fusarium sp. AF-6]|nr:hypothetical protein CEP53_011585 [Fusarium sp. AF-6]
MMFDLAPAKQLDQEPTSAAYGSLQPGTELVFSEWGIGNKGSVAHSARLELDGCFGHGPVPLVLKRQSRIFQMKSGKRAFAVFCVHVRPSSNELTLNNMDLKRLG